uniref:Uncharacterized protein n=1 Tax=Arundo donax TaxID=35708 RepID=A0A0A9EQ23_ARUDO
MMLDDELPPMCMSAELMCTDA